MNLFMEEQLNLNSRVAGRGGRKKEWNSFSNLKKTQREEKDKENPGWELS